MSLTSAPLRLFVTGLNGQLVNALFEQSAYHNCEISAFGLPELDLSQDEVIIERIVRDEIKKTGAQAVINAAAYTAVDKAEDEPDLVMAINGKAPGAIARATHAAGIPILHISTDYVFDGQKKTPWVESDAPSPLGVYGKTKYIGEIAVQTTTPNHVIFRTSWVYAPFGVNFVKTMLRLAAEGKEEISVVNDQIGNPTSALENASALCQIARQLVERPDDTSLRGIFHLVGRGQTSWADFAAVIFEGAKKRKAPFARVKPISSSDFPTKAKRPLYSCLDTTKLASVYGITLPHWTVSLDVVLDRLLSYNSATTEQQTSLSSLNHRKKL